MTRPARDERCRAVRLARAVAGLAGLAIGATGCPVNDLLVAGQPDGGGGGVSTEAGGNVDGGDDTSGDYLALDDAQRWSFFDVSTVGGQTTYSGVAFDGRYLYFVPQFSPPEDILRYDTQASLSDPSGWAVHALIGGIVAAGGSSDGAYTYLGGAFDGRYVYLAPFGTNTYAVQFDTQGSFTDAGAWQLFDATAIDSAADYWGVITDGRYAYFAPNTTTTVLAYDSKAAGDAGSGFASKGAWSGYNLGTGPDYSGFWGGIDDGHYLYLAPFTGNVAARHDTTQPLTSASSWSVGATGFDFSNNEQISPPHFWGAAFDGSRVYMLPYKTQGWTLAAYSTSGSFNDDGSWTTCALDSLLSSQGSGAPAFVGSAFDGRRLFLAPSGRTTSGAQGPLPVVTYDTTQPFCPTNMATSYTTFDPTMLEGGQQAQGFEGAAFDGQYVYFVPHSTSVLARFQARRANAGLSPAGYRGSWW